MMIKKRLNFYKSKLDSSLLERASELFSNIKTISKFLDIKELYYLDKEVLSIDDKDYFISKVLKDFATNIKEFTTTTSVDYTKSVSFSNNYSVFISDKYDNGPILRQIITKAEIEVVIVNYDSLFNSRECLQEFIGYMKTKLGFDIDYEMTHF